MKQLLKEQAVLLRQEGRLYSEIAAALNISPSTAKLWTKEVVLSTSQAKVLEERQKEIQLAKMQSLTKRRMQLKNQKLAQQRLAAKALVSQTHHNTAQRQILCAVFYWCEGTKDVSSGLKFTNADPQLVATFLALLRSSFSVDESKFRALMHLHDYHDQAQQLEFWSQHTGIPPQQFHRSYVKSHRGARQKVDYPGTVSIRYLDAALGKLIKMIYSEYGRNLGE